MLYPLSYGGKMPAPTHEQGTIVVPTHRRRSRCGWGARRLPYPASPCRRTTTSPPHPWSATCCRAARSVDERGHLHVGGIDLLELAREFGTPLFVYDEDHLRHACREAVATWGEGVAYATKAFLCRSMARLAHDAGMHLDVASGGELHVALSAGVPADRLVLHGNNKSTEELASALSPRRRKDRGGLLRRGGPPRRPAGVVAGERTTGPGCSCE